MPEKLVTPFQDEVQAEMDQHLLIHENSEFVGLILTTFNDKPLVEKCLASLSTSMPLRYPYMLIAIDCGSTDGTLDLLHRNSVPVFGPHSDRRDFPYAVTHIAQALNAGIKIYLGYDPETKEFTKTGAQGYVGWIHADMEFPQEGWLPKLVEVCQADPKIGKLGPDDWNSPAPEGERPGNQCPWIMPVDALMDVWKHDGTFFDEEYWYTQGYEDWDFNRTLMKYGWKVIVTTRSKMKHEGMGTRKQHTSEKFQIAARHNAERYFRKWQTNQAPC